MLRKPLNPATELDSYSALFLAQDDTTQTTEINQKNIAQCLSFLDESAVCICSEEGAVYLCNRNGRPSLHVCVCKLGRTFVFGKWLIVNLGSQ